MLGRLTRWAAAAVAVGLIAVAEPTSSDGPAVEWSPPEAELAALQWAYDLAVARAAGLAAAASTELTPIQASGGAVRVVSFKEVRNSRIAASGALGRHVWVSLPDELRAACAGAADPVLALHQVLGLPPRPGRYLLVAFSIDAARIFRPCADGSTIDTPRCGAGPAASGGGQDAATDTPAGFARKQLRDALPERLHATAYPFTAMGWSYDWNPLAPEPYGISEYVVRPGARVVGIEFVSPNAFCGAADRRS
jgi:hypothetical protein